jgi:hypothetical protein
MNLLKLALFINIIILTPLTLSFDSPYIRNVYGADTPSRNILLSMYLAFLLISIYLITLPLTDETKEQIKTLLYIQIIYKLLSVVTHHTYSNPVIISNLMVAFIFILLILFDNQQKTA